MALNPEAPEFLPALNSCIQKGFATMNTTIKLSNNLPVYVAYKQYKSLTDFNIVTQRFNHNVIYQLNSIFVTELPSFRLKEDEYEYNMERLIDANDSVLDRIHSNVDCADKGIEPNQQNDSKVMGPGAYCRPIITTIQVGNTLLTTAKNIPRPQLLFKDTIDNSSALFMPKITDKPNNIKPLALEMLYNNDGEPIGFEHPYEMELSLFEPQSHWLVPDNEPPILPPPVEQTKMTFVCTEKLVDELIRHLETVEVLGVDLEHHSYRTYQGFTCLVQISTDESDFIIDAIAVREHLYKLNEIFTNPKKLKVFHGADMDIQWLQRDFGVYVVGLFDTHQAACALNLNGRSLAALVKRYCGLDVDKSYQLADWRLRPLTEEMVRYARTDTHYLPYIWRRMRADLLMADNGNPQILLSVFESSRQICGITYSKQVTDDKSHMVLYQRSKRVFNARQMAALRMLYRWRDEAARSLDESTMYLLPNHQLVSLAEHLPRDTQGVAAVCHPMPPFVKQNLVVIHRMLLSCRELAMDPRFHMSGIAAACLEPPAPEYDVHDLLNEDEDGFVGVQQEQNAIGGMELTSHVQSMSTSTKPDIQVFYTDNNSGRVSRPSGGVVQPFLPPYDRHSKFRTIAQHQEIRELKEKEAKIAAISKGNELIQTELLNKLQTIKEQTVKEQSDSNNTSNFAEPSTSKQANETVDNEKRKNKKDKKKNNDKNKTNEDGQKPDMTTSEPDSGLRLRLSDSTNDQSDNAAEPHGQTDSQTVNNRHQLRPYKYDKSKYAKFRDQKKHKNHFN